MKLTLCSQRTLDLSGAESASGLPFLSAASGLVRVGDRYFVIADDELSIALFPLAPKQPGRLVPIAEGELPKEASLRKKLKPDWEALLQLPSIDTQMIRLLALPSGSKPNRVKGRIVELNSFSLELIASTEVNFADLYSVLSSQFSELNIEGAVIYGKRLILFQRGNAKNAANALIELELSPTLARLNSERRVSAQEVLAVHTIDLGTEQSTKLSFTDAACDSQGRLWFLAAAEATDSAYDDGEFKGSIVGQLGPDFTFISHSLDCKAKPEGLWIEPDGRTFWIVTDADDPNQPSELLKGEWPLD